MAMDAWQEIGSFVAHPLVWPIATAAVAGLVAFTGGRRWPAIARAASVLGVFGALAWTVALFIGPRVELETVWLALDGFTLTVAMSNRALGALVAMGSAFIALLVALHAVAVGRSGLADHRFHAFLCWSVAGAIGAALADDLIWLLICWEVVSLCLYMLLNEGRAESSAGAAKAFGMVGFGDAAMLAAIVLIVATEQTTRISALSIPVGTPVTYLCYVLFLAAALAKAGAFPLHSWIPTAGRHGAALVMALLPASLDKLLGIYLLARFSLEVFILDAPMRALLMVLGGTTVLAAVLMAMVQHRLKPLLSFHAVSQVGYMVLGIGTGVPIGIIGGIFHMLNHAIYKSCLFLTADVVERTGQTDDLNRLGGLARTLPITFVCCLIAALAISGVPPLNGFVSKWFVYQGCLDQGSPLALLCLIVAVFGSALTFASFFKVITSVYFGPPAMGQETARAALPVLIARGVPMMVLAGVCVAFGVGAAWPLQALILPAARDIGVPLGQISWEHGAIQPAEIGLWSPGPATMLILIGVLGGLVLYLIGRVGHARVTNTFTGGEVFEGTRGLKFAASGYYQTVENLPGVGGALRDGSRGAFDVYRLGGTYGSTLVEMLRRRHTGVLSLYVSWCIVGVVVIAVYLMVAR